MEQKKLKELIDKEALNTLTKEEVQLLEAWYQEFDEKEKDLIVFKDQGHENQIYARLLQRIHDGLPLTGGPATVIPNPVQKKNEYFKFNYWLRLAAVVALVFGSIPLFLYLKDKFAQNKNNTQTLIAVYTGTGKMKELTLEDGSVITLNSATKLRYPKYFTGTTREVYLEGEAFFKVSHHPEKPFIVHAGVVNATVLGTSFNIRAYQGLDKIKVSVATGRVGVDVRSRKLAILIPDQQIQYHEKSNTFAVENESAASAMLWKQGRIRLDGVSFDELVVVLKSTYGLQLETQNPAIRKVTFKISFNSYDPVESVMRMISKISDSKFRIKEKNIMMY